MKQDKKLMLGMAILFFITFVALGTLVVTEKLAPLYTDRVREKIKDYIATNYNDEKDNLKIEKITYKAQTYQAKVSNKQNKDLYFTITYKNKKITDTYKKDYLEGKTLLTTIENNLEEKIKDKLNIDVTITFPLTLNKYTNQIRENIITNNLEKVNVYNIKLSIDGKLRADQIPVITNQIQTLMNQIHELQINPNHYTININHQTERKKLTIYDLTDNTIQTQTLTQALYYIMIDNEEEITNKENFLEENHISYEYRRYGDE